MKKFKIFLFSWFPAFFWMGVIYFLSSFHKLQASPVNWQDLIVRKIAHFLEYAILSILYYRGLKNTTKLSFKKILIFSFFLAIFYALSDECHQTRVYGRTGRPFDIGVDSAGALFGLFFLRKIFQKFDKSFFLRY